jgi:hypothetical protein
MTHRAKNQKGSRVGIATILLAVFSLIALAIASDFDGDLVDDAYEKQYGISTNGFALSNLIEWFQFEGTNSVTNTVDRTTNAIQGTMTGFAAPVYIPGIFNNALSFMPTSRVAFF